MKLRNWTLIVFNKLLYKSHDQKFRPRLNFRLRANILLIKRYRRIFDRSELRRF